MKIGAMNYPPADVRLEIDWIGQNGFDFIDFAYEPPSNRTIDIRVVRNLLKRYKLGVVGHTNPTLPTIYPISQIREVCIEELKHTINFFASLQVNKINIHPFYYGLHQDEEERIEANISVLQEMSDYCDDLEIDLMLENFIAPFDNPMIFARIIKYVPKLKIHLDIGHCNIGFNLEEILTEFFSSFGNRICHLHVHDNHGLTDEHLPLGAGGIDWPGTIKLIKSFGYDDTITLEVFAQDRDYLLMSRNKLKRLWDAT